MLIPNCQSDKHKDPVPAKYQITLYARNPVEAFWRCFCCEEEFQIIMKEIKKKEGACLALVWEFKDAARKPGKGTARSRGADRGAENAAARAGGGDTPA